MKREFFMKAIGGIDDDLVCEAVAENKKKRLPWRAFGGVAAAVVVACGVWTAAEIGGGFDAKNQAEAAPDGMCPAEKGDYNAGAALGDGVNGNANPEYTYTADEADTAADDMWIEVNTTAWFFICKDGVWTEEIQAYPDGVPDSLQIANDYLAAIGADAKCVSLKVETVGETDRVIGDIIVHEVGVRTAHVTLDGTLTDDELRGFVATVGNLTAAHYVRPVTADGGVIPLDGDAPDEGYKANMWRK